MHAKYDFETDTPANIVYVRKVAVKDLPQEVQAEVPDLDSVYSVHRADGAQLALVHDRALAFSLARQHDLAPVTVH
ncbi:DUF1150 domain-containing protein [Rhodobacteraceae bacterium D3-12]|nr:DUF1150 domain-containing protein [Rhodobacteraceae bacterium D3-12]